jgi:catechol 2,3-dioxygenase-like lactoylglutathione lyase family enzyme
MATKKARLVGITQIALEVGDIDEALDFYGGVLSFELRGRVGSRMAFVDAGDQFIALSAGRTQPADEARHFGLVVDDAGAVRRSLEEAGVEILAGSGLDFRDPWGSRIQIVQYDQLQFLKAPAVLRAMGLDGLGKTDGAVAELRRKGIEPDES